MRASFRIGGYLLLATAVAVLGSSLLGIGKSHASASILAVQPPSQVVHVGDTLSVDLKVSGVTKLAAWQVRIKYDPAILQFAGYEKTDWLNSTGRSQQCVSAIVDGPHGSAQFGCNSTENTPDGPDGDGVVAHVSFTALTLGTSDLVLAGAQLANQDGDDCCGGVSVNQGAAKVSDGSGDTTLPPTPTPNPITPTAVPGINDDLRLPTGAQAAATANAGAVASGAATPPSGVASAGSSASAGPPGSAAAGDIFSGSGSGSGSSPSGTGAPHAGTGTQARVPSALAGALAAALAVAGVACVLASRAGSFRRLLVRLRR